MIDVQEHSIVECNGNSIVSEVSHLQLIGSNIYGKTQEEQFFSITSNSQKAKYYLSKNQLIENENLESLELKETPKFYGDRKWEITGTATIITLVVSSILTLLIVLVFNRLVLKGWHLGLKSKTATSRVGKGESHP